MSSDAVARSTEVPWFLRQGGGQDGGQEASNFVEIAYISGWEVDPTEGIMRAVLDVPQAEFDRMLERAAKHRGYLGGTPCDVHEVVTRDATLQQWEHRDAQNHSSRPKHGARVVSKRLIEARPFNGTNLLVRTYARAVSPFSAFPCDAPVQSYRRVRRLELRMHRNARIVFEAMTSSCEPPHRIVRRVRIEIVNEQKTLPDLQRTVENTIQVVLLGLQPQGKGMQLGSTRQAVKSRRA